LTQIFPFEAWQIYKKTGDHTGHGHVHGILNILVIIATMWMVLNIVFLCSVDLSFFPTFFWTKTAPQYSCEQFTMSKEDFQRWDVVFTNRLEYTESVHSEVKEWVGGNIARWKEEKPSWFIIEMISDDFLPRDVFEAEGGAKRRRSSVSLREIVGVAPASVVQQPFTLVQRNESEINRQTKEAWKTVAKTIYETRSNNYKSNIIIVRRIFAENKELMKPLLVRSE